ncbi:MAG: DUF2231 domain-containing protein [Micromonosporaceae bacterium]
MFEELLGIPAHPLLVHAAVVFVPLQILAIFAYTLLPAYRRHTTWFVLAVAVIGPLTALAAKLSGQAFRDRLVRNGTTDPGILAKIDEHRSFGDRTFWTALALGVLMLAFMWMIRSRERASGAPSSGYGDVLTIGFTAVLLVLGLVTAYFVFKTGDTGAHIVWSGF